ncbi:MAG: AAA family ATPase, partial [Gemmatimonadetes bacterium]|nr:AAA family ATPase [Gemmatimonadota bacterium]
MSEEKTFLEKVHIKNFLSLRDVELPLKPLTVLVGPNASGKSNILNALQLLKVMMVSENLPPVEFIQSRFWAGEANHITFRLQTNAEETETEYKLRLKAEARHPFDVEELLVNSVKAISIQNGQGIVQDEDGENETQYRSNKLALKSAGDYGNKPITRALTEFIKGWEFYDFQPELIRRHLEGFPFIIENIPSGELSESPKLDDDGSTLSELLSYWHENTPDRFHSVSKSLAASTNIRIAQSEIDGDNQLCLLEGYKQPIPLKRA